MSFFEAPPPPPPPPEEHFHRPEWMGPPENVLGVAVPLRLVLARSPEAAVLVQHLSAYPKGVTFDVSIHRRRAPEDPTVDPMHRFHMWQHTSRGGQLPPELLRFGVQLADGSKATTLGPHPFAAGRDQTPDGPVLMQHGGGGGGLTYTMGFWLWPLPPAGALGFVVEWPSEGIDETRIEIDSASIREAANEAETLWSQEEGSSPGGFEGVSQVFLAGNEEAED
jgi:hypothetical protein